MRATVTSGEQSEWRAGWRVVVAAMFAYGSGMGLLIITASFFILPMQQHFGWSKSELSMVPVVQLLAALSVPFWGRFIDWAGARRVVIIGLLGLAAGFVSLALMPANKTYFLIVCILIGLIAPLSNIAPLGRGVATWFQKRRGSAFGLMLNGVSLLALISVPLVSYVIQSHGWRVGYLALAAFVLCIGLPPVLVYFRENSAASVAKPEDLSGVTLRTAVRDFRFWTFLTALSIAGFALSGFVSYLQPILAEKGFTIAHASALGMLFAVSISIGRIVGGILLDRFWDCGVAAVLLALSAAGALMFSVAEISSPLWMTLVAITLVGMAQGAEADFIAYFFLRLFGLRDYSTILGVMAMCAGLAGALGAYVFAALGEAPGSAGMICQIGAACYFIAGIIILLTGLKERSIGLQ